MLGLRFLETEIWVPHVSPAVAEDMGFASPFAPTHTEGAPSFAPYAKGGNEKSSSS
jgi:hypothetical protein